MAATAVAIFEEEYQFRFSANKDDVHGCVAIPTYLQNASCKLFHGLCHQSLNEHVIAFMHLIMFKNSRNQLLEDVHPNVHLSSESSELLSRLMDHTMDKCIDNMVEQFSIIEMRCKRMNGTIRCMRIIGLRFTICIRY
eukprot:31947_1